MSKPEDKTILVVDDEDDVRDYLATVLEDAGFRVVTAEDGARALERLEEGVPDFISLDLVMPNKGGMRFLRDMRRNPAWADIPFVVVTAHAHDDLGRDELKGILAGREASGPGLVLEKPVKPERYVRLICERLGVSCKGAPWDAKAEALRREILELARSADSDRLEAAAAVLAGRRKPQGGAAMGKKILVVDDEEDIVEFLAALLGDHGYAVTTATNGVEAMDRVSEDPPALILLDLQMPEETGTGFYRKLRDKKELRGIPVIIVSGLAGRNVAVSRSVPVLEKPLDEARVLSEVHRALGERS